MANIKRLLFYSLVLLIIFGTVALRFFVIYTAPLDQNEPFFTSRANSINQGKVLFTGNLFQNHGPLTSYFLSWYSRLFGLTIVSVHYAALLFDILIFLVLLFLLRRFFTFDEALIGSAIYLVLSRAFSGSFYSSEFPSAFFGLLGLAFYLVYLEKDRYKGLLLFFSGIMIAISIWFKQPGFFFFFAIFIHQIYLSIKKHQSYKACLTNLLIIVIGVLVVSIPILIYFFYHTGWDFLYQLIVFNLLFKTRHSRLIVFGRFIELLLVDFGFLFAVMIAAPKKKEESHKQVFDVLMIFASIMLLFYLANKELFDSHLIPLLPVLILLTFFYIKKYPADYKRLIYVVIIISVLTIFMVNLEYNVREYQKNELQKQLAVVDYLKSLPKDARFYFINNRYSYLSGRESTYRYTMDLRPNVESYEKFNDFCSYLDNVDYMLVTEVQLKYLGDKNIECINTKFKVIKEFDNTGDMGKIDILENKNK